MKAWARGIALLALSLAPGIPLPAAESGLAGYLDRHRAELPSDGRPADLPPGFLAADGPRLYLLGEVHGAAANNDADLTLLETLQRTAGVRTYLSEISYAHAWYVNRYLEKGDEKLLDLVFADLRGRTVDASREKRAFWQKMRAWNRSLPAAQRIHVVGIDLERFPGITRAFLRQELGPQAAAEPVEQLIREQSASRADRLAALGPDRVFAIDEALRNLRDRERAATFHGTPFDQFRDRILFGNFMTMSPRLPAGSIYGRVGFAHVTQHLFDDVQWLSFYLERRPSPWAGRVVGIWPLYWHSRRLAVAHGVYATTDCSDERADTDAFAHAAGSDLTLFSLAEPGSPFSRRLLVPVHASGGVTTDYFQYVLLFKNSPPAEPIR